jgi:RNA polymerase sigma-70 factor (ECF subfamily)
MSDFERLLDELRPKLHRYCARMTGSVVDGEDVVQEALVKALQAWPQSPPVAKPESWLFRIAHNASLDFLRRRARADAARADDDPETLVDPAGEAGDPAIVAASLETFMRLPVQQRSSVILMDVLGYSLHEIGGILECSVPAVKSALHRGRTRLRQLAREPAERALPVLAEPERSLLAAYVDRFNACDFDAIRDMLADEVRLELVSRARLNGRSEVSRYFENYAKLHDWRLRVGTAGGRAAILVSDPSDPAAAAQYFVLVEWSGDRIAFIRDFRYARYAIDGAGA